MTASVSPSGRSVAQLAVESYGEESARCVELLARDRRVDWSVRNRHGDSPIVFCRKNYRTDLVRILTDMLDRRGEHMEEVKVKQELIKNEVAIIKQEIIEETKIKEHPIHN